MRTSAGCRIPKDPTQERLILNLWAETLRHFHFIIAFPLFGSFITLRKSHFSREAIEILSPDRGSFT